MAIALYKVTKEFKHEGKTVALGTEIVLKDRDADVLVKERKVTEGRFLDPEDPDDKKKIDVAEKKHKAKYDAEAEKAKERSVGKKTRDEKKDKEEEAKEAKEAAAEEVADESADDTPPVPPKSGGTPKKAKA